MSLCLVSVEMMVTELHDPGDLDFAEIDIILAQAKLRLQRDRCRDRKLRRHMNLSDIPENFAHVPPCTFSECSSLASTRSVSLDTSQPDFASRDVRSKRRPPKPHQKFQILSLIAPMKWLRGYMGCVMAGAQDAYCDAEGSAESRNVMTKAEYIFPPPQYSSR